MLDPAPPPEGDRGGAVALHRRRDRARRWGEQAVALAKAVDYQSAGTVEFIVDAKRELLLPRDEHPAAGRASGDRAGHRPRPGRADDPRRRRREAAVRQEQMQLNGWAIEAASMPRTRPAASCRRPGACHLPTTPPARRGGVRVDTGVYEGGEIPMHYDPMIAKLIAARRDRAAAIATHARGARRLRDPRRGEQPAVPGGAARASALRRRRSQDRLHRRGVRARLSAGRCRRRPERSCRAAAWRSRGRERRRHQRPACRPRRRWPEFVVRGRAERAPLRVAASTSAGADVVSATGGRARRPSWQIAHPVPRHGQRQAVRARRSSGGRLG